MTKKIITLLFFSYGLLMMTQFGLTLGRATDGDKLFGLQDRISRLSGQNKQLSEAIFRFTTISRIQEHALSSGYVPQSVVGWEPLPVAARLDLP